MIAAIVPKIHLVPAKIHVVPDTYFPEPGTRVDLRNHRESRKDRSERLWQLEARQLRGDRSRRKEKQQLSYSKQLQEEVRIMVEECSMQGESDGGTVMHSLQQKRRRAS